MIDRLFQLKENQTSVRQEVVGGITTFLTMAYIIFVQPVVLGTAGMDAPSVMVATCISSALATFCMAFMANYPIALAPGMGANVFFAFAVVVTLGYSWQQALGAIFVSGVLFITLSTIGFRERIVNALPVSLRSAVAVGIGLMISFVGFEWSGMVVDNPATLIGLGDLTSVPVLVSLAGLAVCVALFVMGFKIAILAGMMTSLILGLMLGLIEYQGIFGPIPSIRPTLLQLDIVGVFKPDMLSIVFVFFFLDLFDTVGTLTGVSQEAGFLRPDGTLPRAKRALLADAIGTVAGSLLGTSTVTSYVESAAGIKSGARTGFASLITGSLFICALFFSPLLSMVGGGLQYGDGLRLYPVIAPALIVVGCLLFNGVRNVPWGEFTEAFPAFLTIIVMPLTFSITEGISFGFISYSLLKLVQGRIKEVHPLIYVFAVLFVIRYALL
jgi:AGZA family xanthine/uracil permease-like MFS transporter